MSSYIDPGVYHEESDLSQYTPTTVETIVGLVHTFNKGPLDAVTRVVSPDDLVAQFGYPINNATSCQGWFAANEILKRGDKLDIVRIDSASPNAADYSSMSLPSYTEELIAATTAANGVTANPAQTLTSATIDFTVAGVLVGDIVEIYGGTADDGFYRITLVAAGVLTVSTVFPVPGAARSFRVYTGTKDIRANGATGAKTARTLTSVAVPATATFTELQVAAGDILVVADVGTPGDNGVYRIVTVYAGSLVVDRDWPTGNLANLTFSVYSANSRGTTGDTQVATKFTDLNAKFLKHLVVAGDILVIADNVNIDCNGTHLITALTDTELTVNTLTWPGAHVANLTYYILPGAVKLDGLTKGTWNQGYKLYPYRNDGDPLNFDLAVFTPTGVTALQTVYNMDRSVVVASMLADSAVFSATVIANRGEPCPGFGLVDATLSIYLACSGGNDGATSIADADYIAGLNLFANEETTELDILLAPGVTSSAVQGQLQSICEVVRQDCCFIVDGPRTSVDTAAEALAYHNATMNANTRVSSYGAFYMSWQKVRDVYNSADRYIAPSGSAAAVWVYNDAKKYPWFAPAGLRRGKLSAAVTETEYSPTKAERNTLYSNGQSVNSIVDFSVDGIHIWGQKTLFRGTTALNRINVRRMLNFCKKTITRANRNLPFEPNDSVLWREFISRSEPLLEHVLTKRGIRDYRVVCDSTTTTATDISEYTMRGKLIIKPQLAGEIIVLGFTLTDQDAVFAELK